MKRRDFISKSISAGLLLAGTPVIDLFKVGKLPLIDALAIDSGVKRKMSSLLTWMQRQGWQTFLKQELAVDVDLGNIANLSDLSKPLANIKEITTKLGMEDFAGNKLIEPGSPAMSLLYHILASPRVKSTHFKTYPELSQLDAIENYIYAFVDEEKYPFKAGTNSNTFLAVLAYEYRPAFKTPPFDYWKRNGKESAKIVYSRCGIARTGAEPHNYDKESRSFTTLPSNRNEEKSVAVMPARYGLFLVELVEASTESLEIMNKQSFENTNLGPRYFINPIKKIFNTEEIDIEFGEYHINEKLKKVKTYSYKGEKFTFEEGLDFEKPPFTRISASTNKGEKLPMHITDEDMVKLEDVGSTLLISSVPRSLIRKAKQNGKLVSFGITSAWKKKGNRRYSALKLPNQQGGDVANFVIADIIGRKRREITAFLEPKVAPLFANIKFELDDNDQVKHIDGESYQGNKFEEKINQGNYRALLFEDSICDGCISARINSNNKSANFDHPILPAFSLVTAPDFFPFADSNDIRAHYQTLEDINTDQDFLEGGTMNLSGIRQRGNPSLVDPFSNKQAFAENWNDDKSFDTLTAVIGVKKPDSRR